MMEYFIRPLKVRSVSILAIGLVTISETKSLGVFLRTDAVGGIDELKEVCEWQSKVAPLIPWQSF